MSIGSIGVWRTYRVSTYSMNLRNAVSGEGVRYLEGWSTGGWARMSSGKAKRIMRLKRYLARVQRLEGIYHG